MNTTPNSKSLIRLYQLLRPNGIANNISKVYEEFKVLNSFFYT